jgi:hypothetical protein
MRRRGLGRRMMRTRRRVVNDVAREAPGTPTAVRPPFRRTCCNANWPRPTQLPCSGEWVVSRAGVGGSAAPERGTPTSMNRTLLTERFADAEVACVVDAGVRVESAPRNTAIRECLSCVQRRNHTFSDVRVRKRPRSGG